VEGTRGASFFDPHDQAAAAQREAMAEMACADLFRYIEEHDSPAVGILDATNTTTARRQKVVDFFQSRDCRIRILFVESVCDDPSIIRENIIRAKCGGADYRGVADVKTVIKDFEDRIENYAKVYEPLSTAEGYPFIKLCNIKEDVMVHKVRGGIPSQITYLLLNLFHLAFPVYLTMPGETVSQRVGAPAGDESLTEGGVQYSLEVASLIREYAKGLTFTVLHGTTESCRRTVEIISQALLRVEPTQGAGTCSTAHPHELGTSLEDFTGSPILRIANGHGSRSDDSLKVRFVGMAALNVVPSSDTVANMKLLKRDSHSVPIPRGETNASAPVSPATPPVHFRLNITAQDAKAQLPRAVAAEASSDPSSVETDSEQSPPGPATLPSPNLRSKLPSFSIFGYEAAFLSRESRREVNARLERAIMEILRIDGPVLVIAPLHPIQGLVAYFCNAPPEMSGSVDFPLHTVKEYSLTGGTVVLPVNADEVQT
jgi:broad specificity phosphatase PhoE